jgi:hypothetical protein
MQLIARAVVGALVSTGLVTTAAAAPAAAYCAPDGPTAIWKITNVSKSFRPTGLNSDWVHPKYAPFHITYSRSATSTWSATVTGTVSTEANAIFAKASASISVAVGKQWSKTQTWTYAADTPRDPDHEYRLRQWQETRRFSATKYGWSNTTCSYTNKIKAGSGEMPRTTASSLVWRLQRRAA